MNLKKELSAALLFCAVCLCGAAKSRGGESGNAPRIINIVNFIRQTDYRVENADSLLFATVDEQIKLLNKYSLPATFLLQYDALINPKYQRLLKEELRPSSEIGAWWEITQPHVEAAGIRWRGEHSWVSTANIAFTTGYTPRERERLVDVYMEKFKEIFGRYPESVGSWYIDSHTLAYMYDKYGIVASCNCKDQVGTDGYTLWGGYWNQAYYPSRLNGYMPAQTEEGQIPVPVFRMLGSDPIYQYDTGLGGRRQGVISLEPVYRESGMNREWVEYFLDAVVNQPCLAFNYAQAGQENSFTWNGMRRGLEMQFPIFDSLARVGNIRIETLGDAGKWFRANYKTTPPTAVTAMDDIRDEGRKTVWYNSRYYRVNLLWEGASFRFRDIHLFDEKVRSPYFETPGEGSQFLYYTLPVVDGFLWSTNEQRAGLRINSVDRAGVATEVALRDPTVTEVTKGVLRVECMDETGNRFRITFREGGFEVSCRPAVRDFEWMLVMTAALAVDIPFYSAEKQRVEAEFNGYRYGITCTEGTVVGSLEGDTVSSHLFSLVPSGNTLSVDCTNKL